MSKFNLRKFAQRIFCGSLNVQVIYSLLSIFYFSTFGPILALHENRVFTPKTNPAASDSSRNCFNSSSIRQAVQSSQIVFIGKILNLLEIDSDSAHHSFPLISAGESLPNSDYNNYYQYNHIVSKRRRDSNSNLNNNNNVKNIVNQNESSYSYSAYIGTVQVKTVFKGEKKYHHRTSHSKVSKHEGGLEGRIISVKIIQHINNNFSCLLRRLRILDTRIFFYKINKSGNDGMVMRTTASVDSEFYDENSADKLNNFDRSQQQQQQQLKKKSNKNEKERKGADTIDLIQTLMPLPPALAILNSVRQAVKDEPCEKLYCTFGANCHVINGKASCHCPESCADGYSPVCGSDDNTYANECLLRKYACKHQKIVRVKRQGECNVAEPCNKICLHGSHCVKSVMEGSEICACPDECPKYNEIAESQKICGSDGKMYENECELNRRSCLAGRSITIKYLGKCDPCEKISCPPPSICQFDELRVPSCQCGEACPTEFHPVCASNGRSYTNDCVMRQEACRTRNSLHIIYRGLCSSGVNPCESITCSGYESCVINRFGIAQCVCAMICDPIIQPVCSTDGRTYDNYCELTLNACRESKKVEIAYSGNCVSDSEEANMINLIKQSEDDNICTQHKCPPGAICIQKSGIAICECQNCPIDYNPVCGSDGLNYDNVCQLNFKACTMNSTDLQVLHAGLCRNCDNHACQFYSSCEVNSSGPKCICRQNCSSEYLEESNLEMSPICGSDEQTYENECELQKSSCEQQMLITIISKGDCDLCSNVQCKFGATCNLGICECPTNCPFKYEPVCAANFETFTNECELQKAACLFGRSMPLLFYGNCSGRYSIEGELKPISWSEEIFSRINHQKCVTSEFGCCPDGTTAALGLNLDGCPLPCKCNKLGSASEVCDPISKCQCLPGVGGELCDRCLPGFWGFPRVKSFAPDGCTRCECSKLGSVRDDCEQMSGHCVCRNGFIGPKCDTCIENEFLGQNGCTSGSGIIKLCDQMACYYGAECEIIEDGASCTCNNVKCDSKEEMSEVCGSDGLTYDSSCEVLLKACREQKPIWILHEGPCTDESSKFDDTRNPSLILSKSHHQSEPELVFSHHGGFPLNINSIKYDFERGNKSGISSSSSGMKSTRHLSPQLQSNYHDNFQKAFFNHRLSISPTTVEMKSYLGDSCQSSTECVTIFSICLNGVCICKEGYYEDSERIQCKLSQSHAPKPISCTLTSCPWSSTCLDHLNGTYSCVCPLGTKMSKIEEQCTNDDEYPIPLFSGKSSIVLGKLAGYHKLSIDIEIRPYLDYQSGVILFSSQYANGSGDFVSLTLIDGYVEFRFDLGNGQAQLRSMDRLESGNNYVIAAKRYNRDGLLKVNQEDEIKGSSPGISKSLNLDAGGYLGFVPLNSTLIWEIAGTSQGFRGCVLSLKVGLRPIDFTGTNDPLIYSIQQIYQCINGEQSSAFLPLTTTPESLENALTDIRTETTDWSTTLVPELSSALSNSSAERLSGETLNVNKCSQIPCKNNGHCWMDNSRKKGYRCICHPQSSGKLCELKTTNIEETGAMLDFRGFSYLELPTIPNHARQISIEIWVMVRSLNGILLYNGQHPGKGDYVLLHVVNGYIQFLYDLGSGMGNLTWDTPITQNKWHWIQASRNGREGRLQIDGEPSLVAKSPPTLSELNLELPLFLGGIRDTNMLHRELGLLLPLDGIFQYMKINGKTYHKEIGNAIKGRLVHKYEGPPCGSSVSAPCKNGGTCFPRLSSYACLCPLAYFGKNCEITKELPGPIRFTGENFVKFPRKILKRNKVQRQNRIEIVLRTSSEGSGVLIWIGKLLHEESRKRGYLGLFLVDGYLELHVNLGAGKNRKPVIIRSKVKVNDGRWHQVLVVRRRRFIVFQVDGSSPQRETSPVGSNVLHSDGRIWIGGVGTSLIPGEVPSKYHQGFVGCVDLVRIEKKRLPLAKIAYANSHPFCFDDDD